MSELNPGRVLREDIPHLAEIVDLSLCAQEQYGESPDDFEVTAESLVYDVLWGLADLGYMLTKGGETVSLMSLEQIRKWRVRIHNLRLQELIDDRLEDGTPMVEYLFATKPELAERFRKIFKEYEERGSCGS